MSISSPLAAGPRRSSHAHAHIHHHPFRLEVHAVTSVSVSFLWSLRPLPLSAMPRIGTRTGKGGSPVHVRQPRGSIGGNSLQVGQPATSTVIASRSPNRRVTKVTVRNVSPAVKSKMGKPTTGTSSPANGRRDSTDWPSDDGATAVEEDEQDGAREENTSIDAERTADSDAQGVSPSSTAQDAEGHDTSMDDQRRSSRIMDANVTVCVNGVPWSQVMVGDSGSEEAFIVVYGLNPAREYDMLLSVDEKRASVSVTTAEAEEKQVATPSAPSSVTGHASASTALPTAVNDSTAQQTASRILRAHTPPMQDTTDITSVDTSDHLATAALVAATPSIAVTVATGSGAASDATLSALQAAVRKARKEASRAESALRNEIEAIRRGLDRMSDVDHRSKQKVLALQESIRQATTHAKDIDQEAINVEGEHATWEAQAKEKDDEADSIRRQVEQSVQHYQEQIRVDTEEVEKLEKELQQLTKSVEEKRTSKDKLENDKIASLQQELTRIGEEIENCFRYPAENAAYGTGAGQLHQHGHAPQAGHVGKGKGGRHVMRGGGRGGNQAGGGSGRRNQHRNQRHPAHAGSHGQYGSSSTASDGDGMTHSNDYHAPASHSTLNPNNPEFVPAGAAAAVAAQSTYGPASASPLIGRTNLLPTGGIDHSPSASHRGPFAAYQTDLDPVRRDSLSMMDPSRSMSGMGVPNSANTWLPTSSTLPWSASSTASTAAHAINSPQISHDIWATPSSSNIGHSGLTGPSAVSPHLGGLRTKTSIPYGLNAALLRGGANPSYTHSRLGDDGAFGTQAHSAVFPPSPSSAFANRFGGGTGSTWPERGDGNGNGGGHSAPVSPVQGSATSPPFISSSLAHNN